MSYAFYLRASQHSQGITPQRQGMVGFLSWTALNRYCYVHDVDEIFLLDTVLCVLTS